MDIFNTPSRTVRRRTLRAERPPAERLLWTRLTDRQVEGFRFRRQQGVGPYFVDFYCVEVRLAVEIDGASHDSEAAEQHDERRRVYLESLGILTVRFLNQEIMTSADVVAEQIGAALLARREELGIRPQTLRPELNTEADHGEG